jgi:hypothetical protein
VRARAIFEQNDGAVTKGYYAEMDGRGPAGMLATALFRAQKRSHAAKSYRGGKFRRSAYDVKNWSLSEVCRILTEHADALGVRWGWGADPKTAGYTNVLYVDLYEGQCSFHSPVRGVGPVYAGKWSGKKNSAEVVFAFCDRVSIESNLDASHAEVFKLWGEK